MTLMDCGEDVGRTYQTMLRWIKKGDLPHKRLDGTDIYIKPDDWEKYCNHHGIVRKGEE